MAMTPEERRERSRLNAQVYYAANRERVRARENARREANPELYLEYGRRSRAKNPERSKIYRAANLERIRVSQREYQRKQRALFPGKKNAMSQKSIQKNLEYYRSYRRRVRGLPEPTRPTPEVCECCGKSSGKKALALDHCHTSGSFRGWLCGNCNTSIGGLGDSIEGLMNAVRYLQRAAGESNEQR